MSQIFTLTVLHQDTLSRMWMVVDMTSFFVMLYLLDSLDRIYQTPVVSINEQCLSLFFCSNNKQQRPIILTVERFEGVCILLAAGCTASGTKCAVTCCLYEVDIACASKMTAARSSCSFFASLFNRVSILLH